MDKMKTEETAESPGGAPEAVGRPELADPKPDAQKGAQEGAQESEKPSDDEDGEATPVAAADGAADTTAETDTTAEADTSGTADEEPDAESPPEAEGPGDGDETAEISLEDQLAAARAETEDFRDRWMRALAELDNTRKRAERDRRDAEAAGRRRLSRDLLTVHDNMNRALTMVDESQREAASALIEGIELTCRELDAAFSRNGILAVEPAVGERFDPKCHEAMFNAPDPEVPVGHIVTVVETGFRIDDRLLRAARVGVSAGPLPGQKSDD
ncbi:MAG: nucleotide exchange factor GrpE [Paracoccaceae bacterium]|nr:nucleotide exchange factor GrpE [Paracoccaceae bacterium]